MNVSTLLVYLYPLILSFPSIITPSLNYSCIQVQNLSILYQFDLDKFVDVYLLTAKSMGIIVLYQLKMSSAVAFRLTKTLETKCNFCFNWCEISHSQGNSLFCCHNCYQDFTLNGKTLQIATGQTFAILLGPHEEAGRDSLQAMRSQLESLMNHDVQETFMSWSKIQSLFEEGDLTHTQIETIEQQIEHYEEERDHLAQFISSITHNKAKSSFTDSQEESEGHTYLSQIECIKENKIDDANACLESRQPGKQMGNAQKLQDYCKNLGATRIVKGYDYYFDTSEIKRYRDSSKPLKTRDFGYELSPNELSSKKEPARLSLQKGKSMRSICSQSLGEKTLKLSEDQLKGRILSYLEPRSQSVTLTRIMGSFVREAYLRTRLQSSSLELISFRVTGMDLHCYFSLFDLSTIHTVKLVNVGLTDAQLGSVLELLGGSVARLVLTGNCLTEQALPLFLRMPSLHELYLGKNRISKYRVKENIAELRGRMLLYL